MYYFFALLILIAVWITYKFLAGSVKVKNIIYHDCQYAGSSLFSDKNAKHSHTVNINFSQKNSKNYFYD